MPDHCSPRPGEIFGSTADSLTGGAFVSSTLGHAHTERMMVPDPAVRTYNHLYALRVDLRIYRQRHRSLPARMSDFADLQAPGIKYHIDGWGSSIRYTRLGEESYEMRAPGPDYTLCTADDMVMRNDTLPPEPPLGG